MQVKKIILVGVGRMGGAMLTGWAENLGPDYLLFGVDPHPGAVSGENPRHGKASVTLVRSAANLPDTEPASAIVLATKPQMVAKAIGELTQQIGPQTLLISVAAGIPVQAIKDAATASQPVVRAMPNIGALVGHSVTAAFASPDTGANQQALTEILFNAIGRFTWLAREADLHSVTAISGSGPAYFFAICEAMIGAAVDHGLPPDVAKSLVLGTFSASSHLLEHNPDPSLLRETVTSPNGTTSAGLAALAENDALNRLVTNAVSAASIRSEELSE